MMCLTVVAVAVMSMVGGVSATAMVEEAAMVAAEEVGNGQGGWQLCTVIHVKPFFFLPSPPPPLIFKATVQSLATRHIPGVSSLSLSLMRCCWLWRFCWHRRQPQLWRHYPCCHHSHFYCCCCFWHHYCCYRLHFFRCPF